MVRDNLNEKQIVEDYKKRFAQILEFTFHKSDRMDEEGEEQPEADPQAGLPDGGMEGGDPNAMPQDPNMGGDPNMMGDDPNMGGDPNMMGDDPNMGGTEDVAGGFAPPGPNMDGDPNMMGDDPNAMQPDDEVVDITELTDAQEATQEEIEQFDEKFSKAISAIKSLEDLIKQNDSKIDALEVELKKRNPTPMEKMNNRRTISYPFNVSPEDYWEEKEAEGRYSTADDKNGKDSEQYTVTAGEINNANDWKSISDTLGKDFMFHQTLDKLLKM